MGSWNIPSMPAAHVGAPENFKIPDRVKLRQRSLHSRRQLLLVAMGCSASARILRASGRWLTGRRSGRMVLPARTPERARPRQAHPGHNDAPARPDTPLHPTAAAMPCCLWSAGATGSVHIAEFWHHFCGAMPTRLLPASSQSSDPPVPVVLRTRTPRFLSAPQKPYQSLISGTKPPPPRPQPTAYPVRLKRLPVGEASDAGCGQGVEDTVGAGGLRGLCRAARARPTAVAPLDR